MTDLDVKTLVLRESGEGDDYAFRLAKMNSRDAERWEERLAAGVLTSDPEIGRLFGPKLDLSEAMAAIDTRDFTVVDLAG